MIYIIFRWIGIITGYPIQWLYFKTKTYYEDKKVQSKKIKGGALIISNHFSVIDYGLNMFLILPRLLYVVSSELGYSNKWLSFGMRFFGGIQANRVVKSLKFIDVSAQTIKEGKLVQIFPEGRNTEDGKIHAFKPSYIMIALRAQCPIVPIISDGNYGLFKRTHVIVGKPIYLSDYCSSENPSRDEIVKMNDMVFNKVLELREKIEEYKKK